MNSITKDINEQIILLRKSGMNIREVAEELSITYDKAKYVLKKAGLQNYKYKRTCEQCNEEFETIRQSSKFCSDHCRVKYNKNKKSDKYKQSCEHCHEVFYKHKKQKYCSKECYYLVLEQQEHYTRIYIPIPKRTKVCIICNNEYKTHSTTSMFCSYECRYEYNVSRKALNNKKCIECGVHFSTTNKIKKYCSIHCGNKFNYRKKEIHRRKKIIENGNVDWDISIERLMKRDKNLCYLCGDKVNNKLDYNDDYYPNIDHVIPISKGGTHTWDNVKLAHRICNIKKSDKV